MTNIFARVNFIYIHEDNSLGRSAEIIYDRDGFDNLEIPVEDYDGSQFLHVGRKVKLEGYECEIKKISVKLEPQLFDSGGGEKHNCQISVLVERQNKI